MKSKRRVFRPNLDDVENLSYGRAAKKKRGTGSRHVCHRLNAQERKLYELSKRAGFLTIKGTGYRKERKGSPICNTFRQRCDALEELCIIIEKRMEYDTVLIDFSTLRVMDDTEYVAAIINNVLKSKYSNLLYDDSIFDSSATTAITIDWEAVQTKPIWGVNERILKVDCTRDEAKAVATDVFNESHKFLY
eukprot:CAMPEP_0194163040 /NCGR_PEP_ID=MMETSP0152-20130528/79822_1 /TAXON_ID=1049557 /ORGANISM="Thalassiothrix antarctica, Strain L6-D1" /LENGTH=190 /DNA_ID=CAMNT_0038872989 /DNA_START=172 /DNA_END=744 /DNA_ORIENTATION=+